MLPSWKKMRYEAGEGDTRAERSAAVDAASRPLSLVRKAFLAMAAPKPARASVLSKEEEDSRWKAFSASSGTVSRSSQAFSTAALSSRAVPLPRAASSSRACCRLPVLRWITARHSLASGSESALRKS